MTDNDDDEPPQTRGADQIDTAFGATLAAIIDAHADTLARRQAVEMVIATHARVQQLLHTAPWGANEGVTQLWLNCKLH